MKSKMRLRTSLVAFLFFGVTFAHASDPQAGCPPFPRPDTLKIDAAQPMPPAKVPAGAQYLGTVGFLSTINDRGYVCEARVVRSVGKEANDAAAKVAKSWRFRAARNGRERIPTVIVINVPVWKQADGTLLANEGVTVESPPGTVARRPL